ncbi:unnamed protein product [Sphenostylis stenocarpa]|uniref:DNA polymerase delta subunit 4 n=1 Tax=Sphenostylis stenocarpa TaxID=92480 RepID=A0AA86RYW3_9FABA|nr:unnamed protein product [Sphenostylis stenocarpa]
MKSYYRQKKTTATKKSSRKTPVKASTLAPIKAEIQDEKEKLLRQFDLNMACGPCVGITRLERWERAQSLGLNPPLEIESLLKSGKVQIKSLWGTRI